MKSHIRRILNSVGNYAVEAEVEFECGMCGIASSPSAIVPGRREAITTDMSLFSQISKEVNLLCEMETQNEWDKYIADKVSVWGTDVVLALSLAFARAKSRREGLSLVSYIRSLMNIDFSDGTVIPLAACFSGGVHSKVCDSFQQIMLVVENVNFVDAVEDIRQIYGHLEKLLLNKDLLTGYSASSGMMISGYSDKDKLELLAEELEKFSLKSKISIGVDVAAEHLKTDNGYYYHGHLIDPNQFREMLDTIIKKYPVSYIEDPFDSEDIVQWKEFYSTEGERIHVVGDDIFSTQEKYLDKEVANGAVIKMNQIGTLSGCLETVSKLKKFGMNLCVSHRSYETEDTFMCDLAAAISSKFIKIGGPRRGDRTQKYNQLIRIYDEPFS